MNPRSQILADAEQLINGDRNNQYGPPTQDFDRTAILWTAYLDGRTILEAHDVAALMCLLKLSRISWQPTNRDSWTDLAGYSACGYETTLKPCQHCHNTRYALGDPTTQMGCGHCTNGDDHADLR